MELTGKDINGGTPLGHDIVLEPSNWFTKLIWRFIKIKVTWVMFPPKHVNCRCKIGKVKN